MEDKNDEEGSMVPCKSRWSYWFTCTGKKSNLDVKDPITWDNKSVLEVGMLGLM